MSVKKSYNYFAGRAKLETDEEDIGDLLKGEPYKTRAVV